MFRRSVLILAFVICLPVLWQALVDRSVTWDAAGIRFLIALPVAAILVGIVRLASRPAVAAKPHGDGGQPDDAADGRHAGS